ncbi:Uma2 family endonuclease [Streptomyces sp. NPDC058746]|uniref:Uma2 family endonuclease n=1 Tax=Streptomyces sp. NPDC058746 TaxID=3346622 RepID=UPI0036CCDA60
MSTAPVGPGGGPTDYSQVADPERALKYAVQHIKGDRAQIIEGVIESVPPTWDHELAIEAIRDQVKARAKELGCATGAGNIDLPGSPNWYVPDIAVVPRDLAKGSSALLPADALLVVEVTSPSNADTDRVVKRRRYAEYGAPLYLLVDLIEQSVTLFADPGPLGYTRVEGPYPFGTALRLPEPFGIELDTSEL